MRESVVNLHAASVTVRHSGLGSDGWFVSIDGHELSGVGDSMREAQAVLWNIPVAGGTATVVDCGSIPVPHQSAGRAASITLADLAMVPAGGTVTLTVRDGDDPCEIAERV
ncbi:hypothetical protein [Mycolicibacterium llatzerense]|uniref:hypothetical protein n=1 Tax=Mycolicibacterium llatzerense TaxID=280871 RepID=UPI0021B619F7|nr:hypothetical protein [Mycolicibacterium llatzerense]MCT7367311.1 hypothetical protein [Mycolicibacterium llatzerense]